VNFNQVLDAGRLALSEKVDIVIEVEATRPDPAGRMRSLLRAGWLPGLID